MVPQDSLSSALISDSLCFPYPAQIQIQNLVYNWLGVGTRSVMQRGKSRKEKREQKESEQKVQVERLPGLGRERSVGREEGGTP